MLETIGTGSFGKVRKIRRKCDNAMLVCKEINFGRMSEKEKSQLVSEVNILRDLRNPFIVKYQDRIVDKPSTTIYIIMEYCSGGDLSRIISKCKRDNNYLEESYIWKILSQCVLALKDCHRRTEAPNVAGAAAPQAIKPVLHRDLKPANILLDSSSNIKMADFGLAKELNSKSQLAQTNVGTPFYMAPEIINEKEYDEKSDIWSLGCLVYELAALRPPFDASNAVSLAVKINQGRYARIPSRYSKELMDTITSMLQVNPRKRPKIEEIETLITSSSTGTSISRMQMQSSRLVMGEYTIYNKNRDLKSRERTCASKEDNLKNREIKLNQAEAQLKEKERHLEARIKKFEQQNYGMKQQQKEPTLPLHSQSDRRRSLGGVKGMDIDDSESGDDHNQCIPPPAPTVTMKIGTTQSKPLSFQIHVDNPQENTVPPPAPTSNVRLNKQSDIVSGVKRAKELLGGAHNEEHNYGTARQGAALGDKENAIPTSNTGPIFNRFKPTAGALNAQGTFNSNSNKQTQNKVAGSPFKKMRPALGLVNNNKDNVIEKPRSDISALVKRAGVLANNGAPISSSERHGHQIIGSIRNSIDVAANNNGNRILRR